jgi:hypothetical protein
VGLKRKCSAAQNLQTAALGSASASTASLALSDANKENDASSQIQRGKQRGDEYQKDVYNGRKKSIR